MCSILFYIYWNSSNSTRVLSAKSLPKSSNQTWLAIWLSLEAFSRTKVWILLKNSVEVKSIFFSFLLPKKNVLFKKWQLWRTVYGNRKLLKDRSNSHTSYMGLLGWRVIHIRDKIFLHFLHNFLWFFKVLKLMDNY